MWKKCVNKNQVVQTEAVRHIKEERARETFQCKLCLAADPACFPYAETIKEMTGHMVLKHKNVSDLIFFVFFLNK